MELRARSAEAIDPLRFALGRHGDDTEVRATPSHASNDDGAVAAPRCTEWRLRTQYMTQNLLGRLERVELRRIWSSESSDFTPWLAREDNLRLLGETVGIELELEAQEKTVGPFRADILCKDTATDSWVLIENQLERTDHSHLGQLLTYAAGLSAVTVVWVAERFTEEHRAALDWLNERTAERINFFGLEIELWRIGESPVAPKFNVISQPNDWTRTVAETARQFQSGELSETKQLQHEFWTEFRRYMETNRSQLKTTKARPQHWMNLALGRTGSKLMAVCNSRDNRIGAFVVMIDDLAKAQFQHLKAQQVAIEKEAGLEVEWQELPGKKESRVAIRLRNVEPLNRDHWPEYHQWLREKLEKLHQVFASRIRALPTTGEEPIEDGSES